MTNPATTLFSGLSAFPLTPLTDDGVDERAFANLVGRLAVHGVDSITALGSTGSYVYLTREERAAVARRAVQHARDVPVIVGVGALRTQQVLACVEDAQAAGAAGVLLAPVSYQPLSADEVLGLYADVDRAVSVPIVVYDNPRTTGFTFTDELYRAVAELPNVAAIKIPGVPAAVDEAAARVAHLRELLPEGVAIGVSGDPAAARGLAAGCDAWFSVIGGTLPEHALAIAQLAATGRHDDALAFSERLQPIWELFEKHGSLRVTAAIAEYLGLVPPMSLPLPIRGLDDAARAEVARVVEVLVLPA
ncbi:dihydrodipicolinate synthase family protein [Pseudoclavibacter endophyticus]|uniref:dihydrodipicolinate synthase family protein n=1 Tax=Pseudoclavibacter endophyticus TaxID=1778590 RepID=UPI001CE3B9D7|nr:dihydrodipicolinate synthase family protein [Pseudoclavibacter endophyticus]